MSEIQSSEPLPSNSPRSAYMAFLLPGAILLAALIISGTLIMTRSGGANGRLAQIGAQPPTTPVNIQLKDNDHILGNKDAKVTIVEFSDFQCPFCRSFFSDTFDQLKKTYIDTGKAKLIYRYYPLDFHPQAKLTAEAAECANEQGKFWQMHDQMFKEQAKKGTGTVIFTAQDVKRWAAGIGLNMAQFNPCLDSNKYDARINEDLAYGTSIGVSGTPSFFINGDSLVGAQPFAAFQALIDSKLK